MYIMKSSSELDSGAAYRGERVLPVPWLATDKTLPVKKSNREAKSNNNEGNRSLL